MIGLPPKPASSPGTGTAAFMEHSNSLVIQLSLTSSLVSHHPWSVESSAHQDVQISLVPFARSILSRTVIPLPQTALKSRSVRTFPPLPGVAELVDAGQERTVRRPESEISAPFPASIRTVF